MQAINHLYWRAGFGLSPQEWKIRQGWTIEQAVNDLFSTAQRNASLATGSAPDINPRELDRDMVMELRKKERRKVAQQNVDWIKRMANPEEPALLERMSLFWHGHFACTTRNSYLASMQLNTLRDNALGNFRDLVLAMARDVSMIRFLNNQQNRKEQPNENFARELMELFTIGRGNYTEEDIKEAAKAFTGWSSNLKGEFVFRNRWHDYGTKTFMGKKGRFNGDDIIDIILEKRETAEFITAKIYRYFVNQELDPGIHRDLANFFYHSGYNIESLMRRIFLSDWFYDAHNRGAKIKSPVELLAGMIRSLNIQMENDLGLLLVQRALGQTLFNPPNVAGWPGGRSWIDNSTLLLRLNLPGYLFNGSEANIRGKDSLKAQQRGGATRLVASIDLQTYFKELGNTSRDEILEILGSYLLVTSTPLEKELVDRMAGNGNNQDYIKASLLAFLSLPEYQVC